MLLINNSYISKQFFQRTYEPLAIANTNKPDKQSPGIKKKNLLIEECLDNLTKMKVQLKLEC